MKKFTALAATAATILATAAVPLHTFAAGPNLFSGQLSGKGFLVKTIRLEDCFSGNWFPNLPECDTPGVKPELPGVKPENKPEVKPENKPENKPEAEKPNVKPENKPENKPESKPETEKPNVKPENKPENKPEAEKPGSGQTATQAAEIVRLVNEERARAGLSPLTIDRNMEKAGMVRAKEIVNSFSHTRPNGTSFATALKEQGVTYRGAGENIAWGQKSAQAVMDAWMKSPGHRANILDAKYTKIGVAHYQNSQGTNYWVQLFAY